MAFLFSGKIEFLCLFAIRDEVTGEKSSNPRENYSNREGFQNMACQEVLYYLYNSKILSTHLELRRNDV